MNKLTTACIISGCFLVVVFFALYFDNVMNNYVKNNKPTEYDSNVVMALNGACKNYDGIKSFNIQHDPLTITVTCNFNNEVFSTIREVYIVRDKTPVLNKK